MVACPASLRLLPAERRALTPPEKLTVSQWADAYRYLSPRYSDHGGPISIAATPYMREILDAFADPEIRRLTLILSRQMGKSTLIETLIGYVMHQAPGPAQLILPSKDDAEEVMDRVRAMIEASPALSAELLPDKNSNRRRFIRTYRMHLSLGWAGSANSLKGRSNRYLFEDEAEAYKPLPEGHPIDIAEPSTRTFPTRKIVAVTTPKWTDGRIYRSYLKTDERRYQVPCPHCGKYQEFRFTRRTLRWPENVRDPSLVEAEQLATYHCEVCEGEWPLNEKAAIVARGIWVPRGCKVIDGELVGDIPVTNHRGYQGCCLLAPWTTYSELAAAWLTLYRGQQQEFWNLWMGLPYDDVIDDVTVEALAHLEGEYSTGEIPAGVRVIVVGADAQREGVDHCYYSVDGFGEYGECWHLEHGVIARGPDGSDLERLRDYFRGKVYQTVDGVEIPVRIVGIDSGDGKRAHDVYDIANRNPGLIVAVQGFHTVSHGRLFRETRTKKSGQLYIAVGTTVVKQKLTSLIANPPTNGGRWWIPKDCDQEYRDSLVSEHLVSRRQGQTEKKIWEQRPDGGPNHYWDCRVYSQALAEYLGVHRIRTEQKPSDTRAGPETSSTRRPSTDRAPRPRMPRERRGGWMRG